MTQAGERDIATRPLLPTSGNNGNAPRRTMMEKKPRYPRNPLFMALWECAATAEGHAQHKAEGKEPSLVLNALHASACRTAAGILRSVASRALSATVLPDDVPTIDHERAISVARASASWNESTGEAGWESYIARMAVLAVLRS